MGACPLRHPPNLIRVVPAWETWLLPRLLFRRPPQGAFANATDKFLAASAHVDRAAVAPLPNSRKIYVEGSRRHPRADARSQPADTPTGMGGEKNPPIYVHDCSAPYTDPPPKIDIRSGLPAPPGWIEERGDTEVLADLTSEFGGPAPPTLPRRAGFPCLHRKPRQGGAKNVPDALRPRASSPRDGIRRSARTSTASNTSRT